MFKKILVPYDFTTASKAALSYALYLAGDKKQLVLMHVLPSKIRETISFYEVPDKVKVLEERVEFLRKKAVEELEKISNSLSEKGIHTKIIFKEGDPSKEVIEESSQGYDLVVVGVDRERAITAGTAFNIVRGVRTNVLVVKEQKSKVSFKRVLFAGDFSEVSKEIYKSVVVKFVKKYECELTILNVFELYPIPYVEQGVNWFVSNIDEVRNNLKKRLRENYPDGEFKYEVIEGTDAGVSIVDYAESNEYNLIILGHEEKGLIERAFLGSVSTKVLKLSKIAVLVVKRF